MGLDGHDRGVKLIARALRDSGIHVIYSGLWQTPRSLAISARDEDVDCIAAFDDEQLAPGPGAATSSINAIKVGRTGHDASSVGGIIPQEDVKTLLDAGVSQVHHTGTGASQQIIEGVRSSVAAAPSSRCPISENPAANLWPEPSACCPRWAVTRPTSSPSTSRNESLESPERPGAGKSTLVAAVWHRKRSMRRREDSRWSPSTP